MVDLRPDLEPAWKPSVDLLSTARPRRISWVASGLPRVSWKRLSSSKLPGRLRRTSSRTASSSLDSEEPSNTLTESPREPFPRARWCLEIWHRAPKDTAPGLLTGPSQDPSISLWTTSMVRRPPGSPSANRGPLGRGTQKPSTPRRPEGHLDELGQCCHAPDLELNVRPLVNPEGLPRDQSARHQTHGAHQR